MGSKCKNIGLDSFENISQIVINNLKRSGSGFMTKKHSH